MSQPRTGGCLCGAICYETVGDPVFTLRCHCLDCQRQSGAAQVPVARVPSAGFRILQGTPRRYVTKADSGNEIVRVFCGDCSTPLYAQVATRPDLVGLRVCTLDDPSWFRSEADIFMRSAQLQRAWGDLAHELTADGFGHPKRVSYNGNEATISRLAPNGSCG